MQVAACLRCAAPVPKVQVYCLRGDPSHPAVHADGVSGQRACDISSVELLAHRISTGTMSTCMRRSRLSTYAHHITVQFTTDYWPYSGCTILHAHKLKSRHSMNFCQPSGTSTNTHVVWGAVQFCCSACAHNHIVGTGDTAFDLAHLCLTFGTCASRVGLGAGSSRSDLILFRSRAAFHSNGRSGTGRPCARTANLRVG